MNFMPLQIAMLAVVILTSSCSGGGGEQTIFEDSADLCSDGIDNDDNGLADCLDPSCSPYCEDETCGDGDDNDGDTLIDCDDPDCESDPACEPPDEICSDIIDNDGDTLADCDDPDCEEDPACREPPPDCETSEDCNDHELCIDGACESLEGRLLCSGPERALVLIDQRLYAYIFLELHEYIQRACERREFGIRIVGADGLDDMSHEEVRNLLIEYRDVYSDLDGVLFVGNVPLPTFFMSRPDVPQVQYWPRYYEDLDMSAQKTIPDGTVLDECSGGTDSDGYPLNWPCIAADSDIWPAPHTVQSHDFDDFGQGPHYGLELWAAFLPVGFGDPLKDDYYYWGEQLKPFLRKTLVFYDSPDSFHRNLYHVGNDLNMIAQVGTVWDAIGPENIDYYAINTLGEGQCDGNPDCYLRAPMEEYGSLEEFLDYAGTLPWMGEGWQSPVVFLTHISWNDHFPRSIVWWNVHSTPTLSIITSAQARTAIEPGMGGLIALLDGCMVGSFQRPGSPLPEDAWEIPYPFDNMLVSLVYGTGAFVAAVGSLPLRTTFDKFGVILDSIYVEGYLGLANRDRSDAQDLENDLKFAYRGHQEILIGDPFVDAQ